MREAHLDDIGPYDLAFSGILPAIFGTRALSSTAQEMMTDFILRHDDGHTEALHVPCIQICNCRYVLFFHLSQPLRQQMWTVGNAVQSYHACEGHVRRHAHELHIHQLGNVEATVVVPSTRN